MKSPLLVVGSVALDSVITPFGKATEVLGGSATYFSTAASFFTKVRLVGVVGFDFPKRHVAFLRGQGIDLRGLQKMPGHTFRWTGRYEYDFNEAHTIETRLNVFESFRPRIPDEYRDSPFVFLANIDPDLQLEVLQQVRRPRLVAFDTMNYWIERKPMALLRVMKKVNMVIVNETEAREVSRETNLVRAARKILSLGPRIVIIKRGEYGALMVLKGSTFFAPAFPLETVVDPTGAGDTFAGGLMGYLAQTGHVDDTHLRRAIVYGSALASFNVEDFSLGRLKTLKLPEINKRFREFRSLTHFHPV